VPVLVPTSVNVLQQGDHELVRELLAGGVIGAVAERILGEVLVVILGVAVDVLGNIHVLTIRETDARHARRTVRPKYGLACRREPSRLEE